VILIHGSLVIVEYSSNFYLIYHFAFFCDIILCATGVWTFAFKPILEVRHCPIERFISIEELQIAYNIARSTEIPTDSFRAPGTYKRKNSNTQNQPPSLKSIDTLFENDAQRKQSIDRSRMLAKDILKKSSSLLTEDNIPHELSVILKIDPPPKEPSSIKTSSNESISRAPSIRIKPATKPSHHHKGFSVDWKFDKTVAFTNELLSPDYDKSATIPPSTPRSGHKRSVSATIEKKHFAEFEGEHNDNQNLIRSSSIKHSGTKFQKIIESPPTSVQNVQNVTVNNLTSGTTNIKRRKSDTQSKLKKDKSSTEKKSC